MLKLNLFPIDELKTINASHNKSLKLLLLTSVFLIVISTTIVIAKLYSLSTLQSELTKQVKELTYLEANQKDTLNSLRKKQESILANTNDKNNNVDVAQFLRLLIHTKARNVIYEIKATAKQIDFVGFSGNRASVIEFSEQLKKSKYVSKITNFVINKTDKNTISAKYPLSFRISVTIKGGNSQ